MTTETPPFRGNAGIPWINVDVGKHHLFWGKISGFRWNFHEKPIHWLKNPSLDLPSIHVKTMYIYSYIEKRCFSSRHVGLIHCLYTFFPRILYITKKSLWLILTHSKITISITTVFFVLDTKVDFMILSWINIYLFQVSKSMFTNHHLGGFL